jgi:hypothetical protein
MSMVAYPIQSQKVATKLVPQDLSRVSVGFVFTDGFTICKHKPLDSFQQHVRHTMEFFT